MELIDPQAKPLSPRKRDDRETFPMAWNPFRGWNRASATGDRPNLVSVDAEGSQTKPVETAQGQPRVALPEDRVVAFIDILGFQELVERMFGGDTALFERFLLPTSFRSEEHTS